MNHDPMCNPSGEYESFLAADARYSLRPRCDCDLIARVRADERERAAERVAACKTHIRRRNTYRRSGWFEGRTSWYAVKIVTVDQSDAVAAARGGAA